MGIEAKVVPAFLGGFICLYGLVSGFVKERLFLSEALVAMAFGIIIGPRVIGVVDPRTFLDVDPFTREFSRYVIAIQVMAAGITLPGRYVVRKWRTMSVLLGPVMVVMWLVTAGIVHLVFDISFKQALLIASCAAPTDPILANSVVKGRYAEANVPKNVRDALSAESGINDGLGLPFLYFALYLLDESYTTGHAIGRWFYWTWCYNILLSIVIGIVVGYVARKLLRLAESRDLIDKESFLAFSIGLAVFLVGCLQLIRSDDVLCCFIAGHSFTWDDWFREETKDAHFQEVLDGLINVTFFIYFGTIIPWDKFNNPELVLSPWRLILAAVLVLLLRRLPVVLLLTRITPALRNFRQSLFAGWFGPIGVGAIFFAEIVLEEIEHAPEHFHIRSRDIIQPITMFLIFASVLVHGTTLPLLYIGKVVRTRSRSMSTMSIRNGIASRLSFLHSRDNPDTPNLHISGLQGSPLDEFVDDEPAAKRPDAPPSNASTRTPSARTGSPPAAEKLPERPPAAAGHGSLDLTRTITIDETPKVSRDQMDIHYRIAESSDHFRQHVLNLAANADGAGLPTPRVPPALTQRTHSVRDIRGALRRIGSADWMAARAQHAAEASAADTAVSYPEPAHVGRRYSGESETRSDTDLAALRDRQRLQAADETPGSSTDVSPTVPRGSPDEGGLVLAADDEIASRRASRAATHQTTSSEPRSAPDREQTRVADDTDAPVVSQHSPQAGEPLAGHLAVDVGEPPAGLQRARRRPRHDWTRRIIRRRRPPQTAQGSEPPCEYVGNRRNPLGRREDGELVDYDDPDGDDLETGFMENNVDDRLADYIGLGLGSGIRRLWSRLPALRSRQAASGHRNR